MAITPPNICNREETTLQDIAVDNNLPSPQSLATTSSSEDIPPPKVDYYAPPPYEVATKETKLPTYEEVQREKNLEGQDIPIPINSPSTRALPFRQPGQRIITIDADINEEVDTSLLGTDFMFYIAFFGEFIKCCKYAEEFLGILLKGLNVEILELVKCCTEDEKPPVDSATGNDSRTKRTDFQYMISEIFGGQLKSSIHHAGDHINENI
nr:uncharacterized protein LOC111502069 [Leptinotarsa decemlineata]